MTTIELEAYKAELAREILAIDNWHVLDEVKRVLGKIRRQSQIEETKNKLKCELKEALQEVEDAENGKIRMSTMEDLYAELEDKECGR